MEDNERAKIIIAQVLAADDKWGKPGDPWDGSDRPTRIISSDCRWHARVSREDQKGPDGELWDLIQLFAHDELRMTAVFRGDQVVARRYEPGHWEPLFSLPIGTNRTRRRPNHGTEWPM